MNRNQQISLMVAMGLLLTVLIGINARQTILRLIEMNTWEVHTYRVLNKTQQLQALLTHMDNDLRGYLFSNNPYFKADFERNSRIMDKELLDITTLTIDNPAQTKRLNLLNTIFQHKLTRSQSLLTTDGIEMGRWPPPPWTSAPHTAKAPTRSGWGPSLPRTGVASYRSLSDPGRGSAPPPCPRSWVAAAAPTPG